MTAKKSEVEKREQQRVGATLRTLRQMRGWRADDFANEIGISRPYLSNIEAGRKAITEVILANAARTLEVKPIAITHPDNFRVEAGDAA